MTDVAFPPDSRFVVTAGADGMVRVFDVDEHAQVRVLAPPEPSPPAARPLDASARRLVAKWGALETLAPDVPLNAVASGQALAVTDDEPLPVYDLPGGARVTLLSPDAGALRPVAAEWRRSLAKAGLTSPVASGAEREPSGDVPPPPPAAGGGLSGRDRSVANRASLAFLVEHGGTSCLVTGDAHADQLERSVRRLCAERGIERVRAEVMVLPHNGSAANVSPELLDLVDCSRFVVSTDGSRFKHPDPETIELLGESRFSPATVHFNYRSSTTERYADPDVARRLNIRAVYPEDGAGLTVAVSRPRTVFLSYTQADRSWAARIRTVLRPLLPDSVSLWDESDLVAGADWRTSILDAIDRSAVALLLVSRRFVASAHWTSFEMELLVRRATDGRTTLLWVSLDGSTPPGDLSAYHQAWGHPTMPLEYLPPAEQDGALALLAARLRQAVVGDQG